MSDRLKIATTEMHTGGGAVRIVESGFPKLTSSSLMGKRREVLEKHDAMRKCILAEPRGHTDLYGAILVESELEDADMGVIFIHNKGVGMMCGHAIIALARYAVDKGFVTKTNDKTKVRIHCPAGLIEAVVYSDYTASLTFPSTFIVACDVDLELSAGRHVQVDVVYCGVFYVLLAWNQLKDDIDKKELSDLVELGNEIMVLANTSIKLSHPDPEVKCFISGTLIHDGDDEGDDSKNLLVFADKQVERSAGGTCVAARLAKQFFQNNVELMEERRFHSAVVSQSVLKGRVVAETTLKLPGEDNSRQAVKVEIFGKGYYTGESSLIIEPDDSISMAGGFYL
ncbi:trans-L-3-hydroxyproline dehydratase-like [Watersipora subatra]|uniref:trans-L-3-hydroxyproline dehydratase-like n=1 Tax=Watersipora subatra TaxID=2589382 RepID=UPI00355C69B8